METANHSYANTTIITEQEELLKETKTCGQKLDELDMVVHNFKPSTRETKAGGLLVKASLGYTARCCLQKVKGLGCGSVV
jgi:hypothetical protein